MMRPLAVLLGVSCLLFAEDAGRKKVEVVHTERAELPAGGTLHVKGSSGELTVEGWDEAGVEITTIKSRWDAKKAGQMDKVRVSTERKGDELMIATQHRPRGIDLEYRIKVPRNTKVAIDGTGEVHVDDVDSDIRVAVKYGTITLLLPANSDFAGEHRRSRVFGRTVVQTAGSHKLDLKAGYGDILIFRMEKATELSGEGVR